MTASLNIANPSGTNTGTLGSLAATGSTGTSQSGGFQGLFAALMSILSASGTLTGDGSIVADGSAIQAGTTGTTGDETLNLSGTLTLEALLAAQLAGNASAVNGSGETGTDADSETTADPLAAVLDLLIGFLDDAAASSTDGTTLSLDGKAGTSDALKTLSALLANLTEQMSSSKTAQSQGTTQLPAETIDKLQTLNQLLGDNTTDPDLAELKTRIADLLGTVSSTDTKKASASDPTAQSIATLLGQTAGQDKTNTTSQRAVMAQVPDGAKTSVNTTGTETQTGNGGASNQNQAQSQNPTQSQIQTQPTPNQTTTAAVGTEFAALVATDGDETSVKSTSVLETLSALTTSQTTDASQTAQARVLSAAYTQSARSVDLPQVAFEIARHAANGISRFEIQLDPPEMGRIDVKLDIDKSGSVTARLAVDRQETLDLLQRDARALERALSQTGLESSKTNLEFSLRQNPFARQDSDQGQQQNSADWLAETEQDQVDTQMSTPPPTALYRGTLRPGGVNLVA